MPGILVKLKWLTGVRLLMASVLLGSAVALDLHERLPFPTAPLYGLLGLTFGLSLLYTLGLRSRRHLRFQGIAQVALDLVLISLLVHLTGGIDSVLGFMFIFVVFAAASLFAPWGSVCVALLSGGLYGSLLAAEWLRLIPPVEFAGGVTSPRPVGYLVYQVLIHSVAFLAAAILSSHLAQRLRQAGQELERRGVDLRNLRSLHEVIVANISSGLMTLDLGGRVVSFNQAAERITGFAFDRLRDLAWNETPFAPCPILAGFFQNPDHPIDTPPAEFTVRRADGTPIPVGMACSILRGETGEPLGLVAIFQDLTERKRVEEQLRRADRLAALGQLAANIAHEIRNPLAAISGSVEILREDLPLTGSHGELLDIILREAHRLKLITGQFLDFGKPRPLLFRPVALRPLLEETWQLLAKSSERHPETRWSMTEVPASLCVLADADQLRQVVWNLCLNALQSMPNGGALRVDVRVVPHETDAVNSSNGGLGKPPQASLSAGQPTNPLVHQSTEWVEIALQDTGRGIPAQELERIFDPFYTTRSSGTGLGLAIARKILESMGGLISVESAPGVGTTFRIRLRRAHVPVGARV
jgi:two-component system sensor histidine kinase PilS (NtrC family)